MSLSDLRHDRALNKRLLDNPPLLFHRPPASSRLELYFD
jgi:hypothetical protein